MEAGFGAEPESVRGHGRLRREQAVGLSKEVAQLRVRFHGVVEIERNRPGLAVEEYLLARRPFFGVHEDDEGVPVALGILVRAEDNWRADERHGSE